MRKFSFFLVLGLLMASCSQTGVTPDKTTATASITPVQSEYAITVENTGQIERLAQFGKGVPYGASWSPDDSYFLAESSLGLYVYDPKTWEQIKLLETSWYFDWSPDGRYLAAEAKYGDPEGIHVYDTKTWEQIKFLAALQTPRWSPDGRFLAAETIVDAEPDGAYLFDGSNFETIKFIDAASMWGWSPDGKWLVLRQAKGISFFDSQTLDLAGEIKTDQFVQHMAFNPDTTILATVDDQVHLWEIPSGRLIRTLDRSFGAIGRVDIFKFSPTGDTLMLLANGNDEFDNHIQMWDISTGESLFYRQYFIEPYSLGVSFSPDGSRAAVIDYDNISIIDANSGSILLTIAIDLHNHNSGRFQLAYSSDGQRLHSAAGIFDANSGEILSSREFSTYKFYSGDDFQAVEFVGETGKHIIQIWESRSDRIITTIGSEEYEWGDEISFSNDEKFIAVLSPGFGDIQVYSSMTGDEVSLIEFDSPVYDLTFSPVSNQNTRYLLAVSDYRGKIRLWEPDENKIINTIYGYGGEFGPIAISPDGKQLAYHAIDGRNIRIVDPNKPEQIIREFCADEWIKHLVYSPEGNVLAAGSSDNGTLYFWDIATAQLLKKTEGSNYNISFSPEKGIFAAGLEDSVAIWNMTTWTSELISDGSFTLSTAFSTDGHLLAAGTDIGVINIWDVETKQLLHVLEGHEFSNSNMPSNDITSLDFSPNGYLLASAGSDCTVRLWDALTGKPLRIFENLCGPVNFSPDGALLASGSLDRTLWLMGLQNNPLGE